MADPCYFVLSLLSSKFIANFESLVLDDQEDLESQNISTRYFLQINIERDV